MHYTYHTTGTCANAIEFDVEDGILTRVQFINGCSGSLSAVAKLVTGLPVREARDRLAGIPCGLRPTSCPDQLSQALSQALDATE